MPQYDGDVAAVPPPDRVHGTHGSVADAMPVSSSRLEQGLCPLHEAAKPAPARLFGDSGLQDTALLGALLLLVALAARLAPRVVLVRVAVVHVELGQRLRQVAQPAREMQ